MCCSGHALNAPFHGARRRHDAPDVVVQLDEDEGIPGMRTPGPKMLLRFTCTHEDCTAEPGVDRTTTKIISKGSYEKGIVVVPRDADVFQYKTAGFYFKGKGGDNKVNSEFRNEEIKRLQGERKQP